ncbi:MAG: hypothetical protein K940chlam9_01002 [Chlamydiae bacterium]|nr:hypothetical protein [Chlamydiota bacterium]
MNGVEEQYLALQQVLETEKLSNLEKFSDSELWNTLTPAEKRALGFLFLKRAEQLLPKKNKEKAFRKALADAESLGQNEAEVLWRVAHLLFQFSVSHTQEGYSLLAREKLVQVEKLDPDYFFKAPDRALLWAEILVLMGWLSSDEKLLEEALEKLSWMESQFEDIDYPEDFSFSFYHEWGRGWVYLSRLSKEPLDLQKGLKHFEKAASYTPSSPVFGIEYGEALLQYSMVKGDPSYLEEALKWVRKEISDTYSPKEQESSFYYQRGWALYACCLKNRYFLTHLPEHLKEADEALRNAIIAAPSFSNLWLEWGELFLHSGWIHRNPKEFESALEKLTASKIKECSPSRATACIGQAMCLSGLLLEDLGLLEEGKQRVLIALELAPNDPDLTYALGVCYYAYGSYFSDASYYQKGIEAFYAGIETNPTLIENWHALFHIYLAYGMDEKSPIFIRKGIEMITHLSSLRPASYYYLNEWGVALLRLAQVEIEEEWTRATLEEAVEKLENAASIFSHPLIFYNLGCALERLGDLIGDEEILLDAIDLLEQVVLRASSDFPFALYHFACALAHYGELTEFPAALQDAVEQFEKLTTTQEEDEIFWADYGYTLLTLSEMTQDPNHPEIDQEMKRKAESALIKSIELGCVDTLYSLACLYALSDLPEKALVYLSKAKDAGTLPSPDELEYDEWLDKLHDFSVFWDFISTLRGKDE